MVVQSTGNMVVGVPDGRSALKSRFLSLPGLLSLLVSDPEGRQNAYRDGLDSDDVKAIMTTIEAYRTAWLRGDDAGVLKTFAPDAVLLPHHGVQPIQGIVAITEFWFAPGGPPTVVTKLEISVEHVGGAGPTAFAYGHHSTGWTTGDAGQTRRFFNSGTYLNVMTKQTDGSWRIQVHMWDDPANQVQ